MTKRIDTSSAVCWQTEAKTSISPWLKQAVFYQIYPQSFYDSNNDGIGDITGIIHKLEYLEWLGISGVWINPCFVSPFQDAGYDVEDYYQVAPRYGTNRDLRRLCREAHRHGIRVFLDLVAGHTSIRHPWFQASSHSGRNKYTDRYIWTSPTKSQSNSQLTLIESPSIRGQKYVANCFDFQPALNYGFAKPDQPWQQSVDAAGPLETRNEMVKVMDYWLQRGVDGFRVDMAFSLVKSDPDRKQTISLWQDVGKRIRQRYPNIVLISEWGNPEESIAAGFDIDFVLHFGMGGYAKLLLNENCFFRRSGGSSIKDFLEPYLEQAAIINGKGLISVPSSNHDVKRPRSENRKISDLKVIFTFLLTWPGVPFIYYGDEIGMRYIPGLTSKEGGHERTGSRTPMQWGCGLNADFSTTDEERLYLPLDPRKSRPTVEQQAGNTSSLLNHVRRLIALRKRSPALQADGSLLPLLNNPNDRYFAYVRRSGSERFLVVLNPSSEPSTAVVQGIITDDLTPVLCKGVQAEVRGKDIRIKLAGVSYGVLRL